MGLYITIADAAGLDVNVVPFALEFNATMSSDESISVATLLLQEMPGRFASEFDDLYVRLGLDAARSRHLRAWQTETIAGDETIVWRWFGGLLVDAAEQAHVPAAPLQRRYLLTAQGYDAAALDSVAKGFSPILTVPSGTIASQVRWVLAQYNTGAALEIDDSGVVDICGGHTFAAMKLQANTLRQALRKLASYAVAYDNTVVPRFTVDVSHATTGNEFLGPVLYFYDAAIPGSAEVLFADQPTSGAYTTIGQTDRNIVGRPPFATHLYARSINGKVVTATAASAGDYPNPFHPSGYWDAIIDNMANTDAEMPGEAARLVTRNSVTEEQPTWTSFGRARPGQWVGLQDSLLHGGYNTTGGKTIRVVSANVHWTGEEKTFDTVIDGMTIGNPVVILYQGSTRSPLLEEGQNTADLSLVLALTPSNSSRNAIQASVADDYSMQVKSDDGQYYISWYRHGHHHPIGRALNFTAIGQIRSFKTEDDYEQLSIDDPTDSTVGWIVRKGGVSQTMPFDGDAGDIITIELQTAPTPPTATTPLGATIKERARLVPP